MKPEEIRKMTADEILVKITDSREELMKLRFQQVTGQLTDTSRLRILRHEIARMETIYKQQLEAPVVKEAAEEKPAAKPRTRAKAAPKAAPAEEPKTKAKPKAKPKVKAESKEGEA